MAVFYNKERSKYGHLTGQVIAWPVPYEGTPDASNNKRSLPAGYLKCDGSKYFASDYPRLAEILGTGTNTAFMKKNIDDKMWRLYGHCSNCQVEFENRLAIDGKYDEWVKSVERENKLAWIRDQRETINEFKKQDTVEFFQQIRPDGYSLDTEKWEIDTSKIMKQADEYLEYLQKMEDTLQNE